ncbi:MAG: glycosyltransferase family 2 protein [Candidatus Delongbacteria bacterium]|jgi:glycosyltransferase involved in cell wall biosynthesis|nr:glycosyltransferase family 2 protein [Candidatus Delongbacteria bacterium]
MEIKLSVVIITFNEEKNIGRCLKSVKDVADEIVVVDSYSEDNTVNIAESYGAKVITHKFEGHIEQKNHANTEASYPNILSLDADEALSGDLQKQIIQIKKGWQHDAYSFNRMTNYCGRWIKHGSWYPDIKIRLFDRRCGAWKGVNPHDKYVVETGNVKHIKADILHYSYYTVSDHIKQIDYFSGIKANELYKRNKKSGFFKRYAAASFKFFSMYFLKAGFLDGYEGYIIARLSATSTLLKYYKLSVLLKSEKNTQTQ